MIVDRSVFCRDLIVDGSLTYKDFVATTSLYCKDRLVDALFGALRDIPVRYRNGEFIVNERGLPLGAAYAPGEPGGDAAGLLSNTSHAPVEPDGDAKKIYILLTKHKSITAILLRIFTFHDYTHSSIALERDGSHYSFNPVRGFTIERPIGEKRVTTPCRLYCVEVGEKTHAEIESRIKWFVDNPDEYKFNYVGLVFSILRIPVGIGNRYFCSQFVSDLLTSSSAAALRKRPTRYFPRHFPKEEAFTLTFNGDAGSFTEQQTDGGVIL
jgi:hypothetical protein